MGSSLTSEEDVLNSDFLNNNDEYVATERVVHGLNTKKGKEQVMRVT